MSEQIREMSTQFQNQMQTQFQTFQNLLGTLMQYLLPPVAVAAQNILQPPNTQQ